MPLNRIRMSLIFLILTPLLAISFRCSGKPGNENSSKATVMLGASVGPPYLDEQEYSDTLKKYFRILVPENHMKWEFTEPAEGGFDFTGSDKIVSFAQLNSKAVRGHVLLWHMQLPAWVKSKTYSELEAVLQNHINTVVGHFRGKISAWDVANEVITSQEGDDGSGMPGLRHRGKAPENADYSVWAEDSTDDSLIIKAFEFAHAADPDAKLFINDNNAYDGSEIVYAGWNKKQSDILYDHVKKWKDAGVPVHGIGMQLHLDEEFPPDYTMIENDIIRYGALGLEVHFTEIDVRIKEPVTEEKLQNQAVIYGKLAELAGKHSHIVTAFVTWGVSDKYSWIPLFFTSYDSGLLFDKNYNAKPAYIRISEILGL